MSRETSPSVDRVPTPEIKTYQEGYTAFKVRALLGGAALNPDHQLRKEDITRLAFGITEETKQDIMKVVEAANHNPLANASDAQRLREAGVARDQLEAEYNRRSQTFHTILTGDYAQDWTSFMDTFVQKITGKTRDQITVADVRSIYDRYFTGADKHAQVKTYIKDIFILYSKDGKVDYEALKRDREKIQYMAAIFGKEKDEETGGSADEAIAQMIEGHAEVLVNPDEFISQATQEQNGTIRANAFAQGNGKNEKGLQQWLWKYGQPIDIPQTVTPPPPVVITEPKIKPKQTQPTNPNLTPVSIDTSKFTFQPWPEGYKSSYTTLSENERVFPIGDRIKGSTEPSLLAQTIKKNYPDRYKLIPKNLLAKTIESEMQKVRREFEDLGLDEQGLSTSIIERARDYLKYINDTYLHDRQTELPYIKNLKFFPYPSSAKLAYHQDGAFEPYAFVQPHIPYVFVNVDYIKKHAYEFLGVNKPYSQMSREEKRTVFERALQELYPHELTHLTGNLSYWEVTKNGKTETEMPGQVGIKVNKVLPLEKNGKTEMLFVTRGRGLNEAIVTELMERWAKDRNLVLQVPAYEAERTVLQRIIKMMAQEQGVSEEEVFSQFVHGHFTKEGLFDLFKKMEGPKTAEGKRARPYFTSIIIGLMDYDEELYNERIKNIQGEKPEFNYDFTLAYINNSLSNEQKEQLKKLITKTPTYDTPEIYFPYSARRELGAQLGIDLPSLATKSQ